MKKLFLSFIAVFALIFSSVAQCPSYASTINTSCGSWCAYVQMQTTGSLSSDIANISNNDDRGFKRPLNALEYAEVSNTLESLCD